MGSFGGFYKGEKKKKKKDDLEKEIKGLGKSYTVPKVEIIGRKKKKY